MYLYWGIKFLIVSLVSAICIIQDIKKSKVSNLVLISGFVLMILCNFFLDRKHFLTSLISIAIMVFVYIIIKFIVNKKLGFGDVLYGIFQGACLSPVFIWLCLMFETVSASAFLLTSGKKIIPFIPFMAGGLLIAMITEFIFLLF